MVTRAFVTGIGGQDGSYLADRLVDDGLEVHALVLDADGSPEHCPPEVVLHPGVVTDVDGVRAGLPGRARRDRHQRGDRRVRFGRFRSRRPGRGRHAPHSASPSSTCSEPRRAPELRATP